MDDGSELTRLDPDPVTCTLSTGLTIEVVRLKTRQFFRLLKILTHGAGPAVMKTGLDFNAASEEFTTRLLMLVVMSIPDAEQEAIVFLQSMCQPVGLSHKTKPTKQEAENDAALWNELTQELHNPDLVDTIDLIEAIVRQEAPELQALGKRIKPLWELAQRTGQDKTGQPDPVPTPQELAETEASSERSPRSSTSSATSTGGPTTTSSDSPSAVSASASRRRASVASVPS